MRKTALLAVCAWTLAATAAAKNVPAGPDTPLRDLDGGGTVRLANPPKAPAHAYQVVYAQGASSPRYVLWNGAIADIPDRYCALHLFLNNDKPVQIEKGELTIRESSLKGSQEKGGFVLLFPVLRADMTLQSLSCLVPPGRDPRDLTVGYLQSFIPGLTATVPEPRRLPAAAAASAAAAGSSRPVDGSDSLEALEGNALVRLGTALVVPPHAETAELGASGVARWDWDEKGPPAPPVAPQDGPVCQLVLRPDRDHAQSYALEEGRPFLVGSVRVNPHQEQAGTIVHGQAWLELAGDPVAQYLVCQVPLSSDITQLGAAGFSAALGRRADGGPLFALFVPAPKARGHRIKADIGKVAVPSGLTP